MLAATSATTTTLGLYLSMAAFALASSITPVTGARHFDKRQGRMAPEMLIAGDAPCHRETCLAISICIR